MSNRVTLTAKLVAGKDDDLIDWLASLPKGRRQVMIKEMLRDAVQRSNQGASAADQMAQIGQDTAWLRAAFSELPTWMEGLLSRITVMQVPETLRSDAKPTRTGQLSTEKVTRREKRIAKARW